MSLVKEFTVDFSQCKSNDYIVHVCTTCIVSNIMNREYNQYINFNNMYMYMYKGGV